MSANQAAEFIQTLMARAWEEGWEAAWSPMSSHSRHDAPNPYAPTTDVSQADALTEETTA